MVMHSTGETVRDIKMMMICKAAHKTRCNRCYTFFLCFEEKSESLRRKKRMIESTVYGTTELNIKNKQMGARVCVQCDRQLQSIFSNDTAHSHRYCIVLYQDSLFSKVFKWVSSTRYSPFSSNLVSLRT